MSFNYVGVLYLVKCPVSANLLCHAKSLSHVMQREPHHSRAVLWAHTLIPARGSCPLVINQQRGILWIDITVAIEILIHGTSGIIAQKAVVHLPKCILVYVWIPFPLASGRKYRNGIQILSFCTFSNFSGIYIFLTFV